LTEIKFAKPLLETVAETAVETNEEKAPGQSA
jgi:hypothetical protein